MKNVNVCGLSVAGVIMRFYFMMALVIAVGFLGQFTIAAILGLIVAASLILGISFNRSGKKVVEHNRMGSTDDMQAVA